MKISAKSKRAVQLHPQVAELIEKLVNTTYDDIADALAEIDTWKWPRSDLNAWVKVLDKFDEILEDAIRDYDLDKLQLNAFTPPIKRTISEILRFERLLLENSTNRKTFNSYDRLMSLLFTSDLDVLMLALNLLLRPAQQYSAQPAVSTALSISTPRLLSLSKRWPNLHEHGISLLDLVHPGGVPKVDLLPGEVRDVNFTYYRTDSKEKEQKSDNEASKIPATLHKTSFTPTAGPGPITIHIDEDTLKKKDVMEILADVVEVHSLSNDDKFELLCRTRVAKALVTGHELVREKLVVIRLLSIAIYGHTHDENHAASSLFLYEPDLTTHVAELLQLDRGVTVQVQTAAIAALDSIVRYRGRLREVLATVNAGVNHGILMALLRKTIIEVNNPESKLPNSFVEALLSFIIYIAQHAGGGNMVVGAGLVPLLVQIIENRLSQRLQMVSKAMQLVDNVVYGYSNAFTLFCNARGVDVLVERIQHEIEFDITMYADEAHSREIFGSYGELPVARVAVLKHAMRSMHRMMQSSGTTEGLRGLIDSSLLQSIKKVMEFRGLFGPTVLPLAMNIMATFVHNEPTCLPTIQEAGLPQVFYKAIEMGLEPVIEVIQAIPNAIGALCLNQVGQEQLTDRPSIIPGIFSIFTSERHLRILRDKENALLIGNAIDELVRHHPSLKTPMFEAVKSVLAKIEEMGNAFVVPEDKKEWYELLPVQASQPCTEVVMEDTEPGPGPGPLPDSLLREDPLKDDSAQREHDNNVVMFIDVICRFLEGLFQHPPHCRDFIRNVDGLQRIGKLTALPCLPYDYANSVASDSLVQIIRTMAEIGPNETLHSLSQLVATSLDETKEFWESTSPESRLAPMLEITDEQAVGINQRFRSLVVLHIRVTVIADVLSTTGFPRGRSALSLLQTLMTEPPQVVMHMGALHRAFIWENILFKVHIASKGIELGISGQGSPLERSPSHISLSLPEPNSIGTIVNGVSSSTSVLPLRKEGIKDKNAKALKHLTHGLPAALTPFFTAIVKLFYARNNPDAAEKKQVLSGADVIGGIMIKHLKQDMMGETSHGLDYFSVMLGLMTVLLVDERTMQSTLHTVLLYAFWRANGLDVVFETMGKFTGSIERVASVKKEERSELMVQQLVHAHGGLKVALHLLVPLVASKPLSESGQTSLLTTRNKKETDPNYFHPHHFLVGLRLAVIPVIRGVWESSWLSSAPLTLVKSTIQLVLELISDDREDLQSDSIGEGIPASLIGLASGSRMHMTGPDENRIRQLTDMGFPRSAVERALARTNNNISAATELLLSRPFPYPLDPGSESEPQHAEAATATDATQQTPTESDEGLAASADDMQIDAAAALPVLQSPESEGEPGKTLEELRLELNALREPLKAEITRRALVLVDAHPSLIFDAYRVFVQPSADLQEVSVRSLIEDVIAYSSGTHQEELLTTRCRLLALVLMECQYLEHDLGRGLMKSLLGLLASSATTMDPDHTLPKWLASHLLVTEALLNIGDQPFQIPLPKEGDPLEPRELKFGPSYSDSRSSILDFCLRLLNLPTLPRDEFLATLRLLVVLTRDHSVACGFIRLEGLQSSFRHLRTHAGPSSYSYIAIILRHAAEDPSCLRDIMRQEIKRSFSQQRTRVLGAFNYVVQCSAAALRDPGTFIDATNALCELQPSSINHSISLKPSTPSEAPPSEEGSSKQTDMQVDSTSPDSHTMSSEAVESLVHFLVGELMKSYKSHPDAGVDTSSPVKQSSETTAIEGCVFRATGQDALGEQEKECYTYCCFLMQCLTELLFSYDSCKVAFLSHSPKKRLPTPSKEPGVKFRAAVLHFFLSELITFGTISAQVNTNSKSRLTLCTCAMSVIVALCVDSSPTSDSKEISSDLVSVRKFVLEAVSRAIKEMPPAESTDARYGRLLALADLCNRLLTVRLNHSNRKPQDESTTHIAKIMLEKNFVSTLTSALSEVDLNFPNIRGLVTLILRPLENLSRIAIKMSRTSDKGKDGTSGKAYSVESLSSEDDDDDDDDDGTEHEETADLYRHSALGMFGGEMEDVSYSPGDELDGGDDEDEDDAEMEFDDDTNSDATSLSDEIDAADEGGDPDDADSWRDEDEGYGEDPLTEDDREERDPSNDHDADDDDREVDEEIIWQGVHGVDGQDGAVDEGEDEGDEPVAVIHGEQHEPDMSDDEDFRGEIGDVGDVVPMAGEDALTFAEAYDMDGIEIGARDGNFLVTRRHRTGGEDIQIFGRSRSTHLGSTEATVHPLLLDATSGNHRASTALSRIRRPQRGNSHITQTEVIQSVEDVIRGDPMQIFQDVVNRAVGNREAIRVDVAPGAFVNLEQGLMHRLVIPGARVERASRQADSRADARGLEPLLTLQRWAEEAKILNGRHVDHRANQLAHHVILAMLPAAIETSKERERKRQAQINVDEEAAGQHEGEIEPAEDISAPPSPEETPHTIEPLELSSHTPITDVEMGDTVEMPQPESPPPDLPQPNLPLPETTSAGAEVTDAEPSTSVTGPSQASERVTITIHGSDVDITDMGIDPTFLEALPDDIREEVINQHVRDQRAARVERPADSQISPEFLEALPPEIRAELIQQERMEQVRHSRDAATNTGHGAPADIDPASFIASLDPQLRQVVLLDSDEGLLQTLPSYMIAEAGVYRDEVHAARRYTYPSRDGQRSTLSRMLSARKTPPRDAIQLLDKSGVASLIRLLFFPQILKKNLLFKVLVNICENSKTRTELFNLLLSILQNGPGDLAAVDRNLSQVTTRTPKPTSLQTPKSAGKQRAPPETGGSAAVTNLQNEPVPDLVAQRCLEALTYIVNGNELSSLFFLTEHEIPTGLRKAVAKKGKGKEKQAPHTHYPIVLLLGLLDRQSLLKTPSNMDSVVALLSSVTKPLISLKLDKEPSDHGTTPSTASAPVPPSSTSPSSPPVSQPPSQEQSAHRAGMEGDVAKTNVTLSEQDDEKVLLPNPPQIPHSVLRLIVNILTIGECSACTFQQSLTLIQNLSHIPDARDVIAQELRAKAQDCGQKILSDLNDLCLALQSPNQGILASSVAPKFSSPSSDQTKLLRVLKTIDYMYTPRTIEPAPDPRKDPDNEKVQSIYESFRFTPLWRRLGDCLAIIEDKPDVEHIATVLLPLIETLMVVCKHVGTKSGAVPRALRASASPRSPTTSKEAMEDLFVGFTDAHRKILNVMVRNNPSLMSGSFSLLVHNPRVLDFDNKRNFFSQQLHRRPHTREHHGTLQLNVRRARVFEDSFQYLQRKTGDQIKYGKLSVRFYDEEGVDAGGLTREWFQILARQMFDPNYALFQPCAADKLTYQPNKNSWVNPEHLSFFKFVGRVIGKAIYDGRLLDAYFARSLYRQLLGKPVDYRDVEWVDPEYYNSLCWILENDPTPLELTFSVEADEFGSNRTFPLKSGGESIHVTQDNKREFVQLSANFRLYSSISEQIENLVAGFYEIIPKELITIFNEQELELLISGTPDIDVDEWRAATEYNGYNSSDPVIVWWWRALKSFNREERAKVLSFTTGTSRVPLSGFTDLQGVQGVQRFSIHRAYGDSDRLPQAHTCFNQIDLPQYSSYEMLRQQLLLAINEGGEGFGFA